MTHPIYAQPAWMFAAALLLAGAAPGHAQTVGSDLVAALRSGGHVLVMRHARSPRETPTKAQAQPDNVNLERQLDAEGRAGATELGNALRALKVPVGTVLTSPTYRAVETVRFARLQPFTTAAELGDSGQNMQPITPAQGEWLKARAAQAPSSGNTLIVTHQQNLAAAFPEVGTSVAEGETVVMKPDGRGGSAIVARVPIEAWPRLLGATAR